MTKHINNIECGYIYVMYNESVEHYGSNVFKIGKSKDVVSRMLSYSTSYIKQVEIRFASDICIDYSKAEKVAMTRLEKYRIAYNREFFKVEMDVVVDVIKRVVNGINGGSIDTLSGAMQYKQELHNNNIKRYQDKHIEKAAFINYLLNSKLRLVDKVLYDMDDD